MGKPCNLRITGYTTMKLRLGEIVPEAGSRSMDQLVGLFDHAHYEGALDMADVLYLAQLIDVEVIISVHIFDGYFQQEIEFP